MQEILTTLEQIGIIPVVTINDAATALPLSEALRAGGIPCIEVSFRAGRTADAIRAICQGAPDMLVGAGTVLTTAQVDEAVTAGARFVVSPGFNAEVVERCLEQGVAVIPGCSHPSDMERALAMGLSAVKFFPAEQAGGLPYIKAVSAPYPSLFFIPSGGVNHTNIAAYTRFEKVVACGGSWMADAALIQAGDFGAITALCRESVRAMLGFSFAHVGINAADEADCRKWAALFGDMFGFSSRETAISIFMSSAVEIMKSPGMGTRGHLAVAVNSVLKAKYHLERQGFAFDEDSALFTDAGRMRLIYLKDEIAGFAVHLTQRE